MSPFALSVPGFRLGVHSYKRRRHDEEQEDTEAASPSSHPNSDTETQFSSRSRLPSEAINPLSHSPDTLHQLAVAGLSPEDDLPSRLHPGFPHKPIPPASLRRQRSERRKRSSSNKRLVIDSSDGGASGSETDATITTATQRQQHGTGDRGGGGGADEEQHYSGRMRHLNNMTAIMHRCLRDGDIARAKRVLGILMQTRDVDLRIDNLWVIGLEILMRDGEKEDVHERKKKTPLPSSLSHESTLAHSYTYSSSSSSSSDSDEAWGNHPQETDEEGDGEEEDDNAARRKKPPKRWGTAANASQARAYLEALIQQHPYDSHRPHLTSAIDFWPALFSIGIYNLDAEFRGALHQIYVEHGFPPSSSSSSYASSHSSQNERDNDSDDQPDPYADSMDIDDDNNTTTTTNNNDDNEISKQHRHATITALRTTTQLGALEIAARLDTVLENPPYNTHAELLRQRAHLSLFIADLHLPSGLVERYTTQASSSSSAAAAEEEEENDDVEAATENNSRLLLRAHAKTPEERVALARRRREQNVARAFFARVVGAKGWLEDWVLKFLDEGGEGEEG